MNDLLRTKKALILQAARAIGAQKFTPAELEQLRRRLIAAFLVSAIQDPVIREGGLRFRRRVEERIRALLLPRRDEMDHPGSDDKGLAELSVLKKRQLGRKPPGMVQSFLTNVGK